MLSVAAPLGTASFSTCVGGKEGGGNPEEKKLQLLPTLRSSRQANYFYSTVALHQNGVILWNR